MNEEVKYAPIALFVYNRPEHTKKTLEALHLNYLADKSILYVYADGPKADASQEQLQNIAKVRSIIRGKNWCSEVRLIEREKNVGLADNIITGVTEVVNRHGRVIVLEDDLVTSKGFLQFMNDALELYKDEERVMHISGYMFPVKGRLPRTFFYRQTSCWGWATWSRAWIHFEGDAKVLLNQLQAAGTKAIGEADIDGTRQFINQLEANAGGIIKTWAVKWYFSVFFKNGLCLHPYKSLLQNIGFDGSGNNCGASNQFMVNPVNEVDVIRTVIKDYKPVYKMLRNFYRGNSSFAKNKVKGLFASLLPEPFKRSIKRFKNETSDLQMQYPKLRFVKAAIPFLGKQLMIVDIASFRFMEQEIFCKQIYKFTCKNPQPFIIDAGANIGLSVIYFKQLYPDCEILAFEPDKNVFDALRLNVQSFGLNNVELIPKALWDELTTLQFYAEGADGGRIAVHGESAQLDVVPTIRLRQFLNRKVDFLKIDIEGAEIRVLEDCKDLLNNVERIFLEYHSFKGEEQSLHRILDILQGAGFRYNIKHTGVFSNHPFEEINSYMGMDLQLNIFAYRL